jgi:hypothetical protein
MRNIQVYKVNLALLMTLDHSERDLKSRAIRSGRTRRTLMMKYKSSSYESNEYSQSSQKLTKFGMILESKKVKRILNQMNYRPSTTLHHRLHLNLSKPLSKSRKSSLEISSKDSFSS